MRPPERLSLREEQKRSTAQRLLDAAEAAFEDNGYAGVTVDDIVKRAGVSRGTFYLHFETKAAALRAVVHQHQMQADYRGLIEDFRAITDPTTAVLEAWVSRLVDYSSQNRAILRAVYEAQATDPAFQPPVEDYALAWETLEFVKDVDPEDLRTGAMLAYALINQSMHLWFNGDLSLDRERAVRFIARFIHDVLVG